MKYLRRLLGFIASKLVIFTIVSTLLILAFYLAMNTSNIYILLADGMKERASVILTRQGAAELNGFFEGEYLSQDEGLSIGLSQNSPYYYYNVTSFNYDLSMEWMWSWPWEDTAEAVIVEKIPRIVGTVASDYRSMAAAGTIAATPPDWVGGRYRVTLKRVNGVWKIASLRQTQVIVNPTPVPAPATPEPQTRR